MEPTSPLTKILAGGIAGISETLITYPAEFAKTRRQLSPAKHPPASLPLLLATLRTSGPTAIYAGVQALALSNALKAGIRFLAFETARDRLTPGSSSASTTPATRPAWVNVAAGLFAGAAEGVLVVTPGEAVKTKMIHGAAAGRPPRGFGDAVAEVVRREGVRGLWAGCVPVLCKQATNSAVRFTTFAMLQEKVAAWRPGMEGSVASTLVMGGVSGVFTVYASMPFDNIKTRMQGVGASYNGMLDCAAQTLRGDGVSAFWRGTSPRLVRLTLSSGITFTVYDQVVRIIKSSKTGVKADDFQRV